MGALTAFGDSTGRGATKVAKMQSQRGRKSGQ